MKRRRLVIGTGIAFVIGAGAIIVHQLMGGPAGTQILLSSARNAAPAQLRERWACAACVPAMTERERRNPNFFEGQVCQWWLLATPGTELHGEIVAARTVMFELDPGSGLREACLSKEVRFSREARNPIPAALAQCARWRERSSLRGGPEEQVAFAVLDSNDERCPGVASAVRTFESAEAVLAYVKDTTFSEPAFTLAIANNFTFAGQADTIGAGMAIMLDAIAAKGFSPDGFEQKQGYRLYRYKKEK